MGIDMMGRVLTEATIENLHDVWAAEQGTLKPEDVRRVTVPDALVDTGATLLSLPSHLIARLGLTKRCTKRVTSSTGIAEIGVYGTVRLIIQGRECPLDVLEVPDMVPVLVGQIPLEYLDFVVDPKSQRLIGNPAHGGEHMFEMYEATISVAYHFTLRGKSMMHVTTKAFLVLIVLGMTSTAQAQMTSTSRSVVMNLQRKIDMENYQQPMTLKEALGLLYEHMAKQKVELPVLIDTEAFKAENPDAPDIYDTQIKFPPFPKSMPVASVLRIALSQVPGANATSIVRNGTIEVTTFERASLRNLLQHRVQAVFTKQPLEDALEEIADATGISVIVDPRVQEKMKTPVTACFRGDVAAETVLRLFTDMAELKIAVLPSGVYVTTPANADRLQTEQRRWLIRQPGGLKRIDPFAS